MPQPHPDAAGCEKPRQRCARVALRALRPCAAVTPGWARYVDPTPLDSYTPRRTAADWAGCQRRRTNPPYQPTKSAAAGCPAAQLSDGPPAAATQIRLINPQVCSRGTSPAQLRLTGCQRRRPKSALSTHGSAAEASSASSWPPAASGDVKSALSTHQDFCGRGASPAQLLTGWPPAAAPKSAPINLPKLLRPGASPRKL